jgi:hypothetical protein
VRTSGLARRGRSPAAPTGAAGRRAAARRGAAVADEANVEELLRRKKKAGEGLNRARGLRRCRAREESGGGSSMVANRGSRWREGRRRRREAFSGEKRGDV